MGQSYSLDIRIPLLLLVIMRFAQFEEGDAFFEILGYESHRRNLERSFFEDGGSQGHELSHQSHLHIPLHHHRHSCFDSTAAAAATAAVD